MKFSEVKGPLVDLAVDIDGVGPLTIQYRRNAYNFEVAQEFEAKLKATATDEERGRVAIYGLLDLVEGWDVTDEDGEPLKPSRDLFAKLPAQVVLTIFNELAAKLLKVQVPEAKGATSQGQ